MDFLRYSLLTLHILGAAAIIGPALEQLRSRRKHITTVMVWGARAQILTGLALVGVAYASDDEPDHAKSPSSCCSRSRSSGIAEATRKKGAVAWAFWAVFRLTLVISSSRCSGTDVRTLRRRLQIRRGRDRSPRRADV